MIQSKNSVVRVALNQSIFEKGMSDLKSLKILPKVNENDRNRQHISTKCTSGLLSGCLLFFITRYMAN